jgi:membrane protease YdiL (CAAX protease family)
MSSGLSAWIKRHPLPAYFIMAFAGTWILVIPLLLSQKGLGLLALPDVVAFALYFLAAYTGPFASAFIVAGVNDGKAGVRQLLRRIVRWRVGIQWYLLVLIGYPAVFLIGLTVALGAQPLNGLIRQWPLIFSLYLPNIPIGLLLPGLGEETGWRGFALPRLQQQHGPLLGSLVLGTLHGLWHFPAYLVPGFILPGQFDFFAFLANTCAIVASTVIWTWLYNNTDESILFAIFVHATSNANSSFIPRLLTVRTGDPWFGFKAIGLCALLIVVLTRGRLSYSPNKTAKSVNTPVPQA